MEYKLKIIELNYRTQIKGLETLKDNSITFLTRFGSEL